jgi:PAS domain S-box-containing protein
MTPQDEIKRLAAQLNDLENMLRAQHGILQQRGLGLPPGTLERLQTIRGHLENINNQLFEEFVELAQLRSVAHTTNLINSSLNVDEVLIEVMDTVIALTGAERGYIMLHNEETDSMQFRIARDAHRANVDATRFTVSNTVVADVLRTGQPIVSKNALIDPRYNAQESIVMHMSRSIVCVPLIYKDQAIGVVYADNKHTEELFGEKELSLLMAFANQASIAIENAKLFAEVQNALVAITEMKELMDNVFASIASGVITTDIREIIVTYNSAAERILGIPAEDAIGHPLISVLPTVFEGFDTTTQTVREHDRQQVFEIEPVLPQRGPVNLSLKLAPLKDERGVTYGMVLVLDDLTEIKKRDATLNVVRTYLPPSLVRNIQSIDSLGLSGDEREISVIFADVRGFTTFSEQLTPEELMAAINQYLTVSTDAIQLYDGIIDKYMGDAVVGLFNTQLNPQQDHAIRAVRAALSMAYDVKALHEVLPPEQRLDYGIGVDTGVAMLGNVGSPSRKEFTAIGAPFNLAKLLQENALAGEIIISQTTYELVKHIVQAEAIQPRKVKGYQGFQVMYRITGLNKQ